MGRAGNGFGFRGLRLRPDGRHPRAGPRAGCSRMFGSLKLSKLRKH
jgi:hypothetical protein